MAALHGGMVTLTLHFLATTPESAPPRVDNVGIGTPHGGMVQVCAIPPPRTAADTPESPRSSANRAGIGMPCGGMLQMGTNPHTSRQQRMQHSLLSPTEHLGIGTPLGGMVQVCVPPPPSTHTTADIAGSYHSLGVFHPQFKGTAPKRASRSPQVNGASPGCGSP